MSKPNRHNSHILETESNKFFVGQVPNEWFVDKPEHDYGVDYIVNIAVNNQVTGLSFSVQLKSKLKENKSDFATITLKHSTLGLFNTKLEPVLLVVYVKEAKEAYWYWYNDLNIDLTSSQKTFQIKIPKENKLNSINWESIVKYVQNIFSIKTLVDGIKSLEYDEISNSELLAWRHYFSSDHENAIFYFKNLIRENPKNVAVLEGLAQSQYNTYKYKEAMHNINKAIELSGTSNQYLTKACILAEDGVQNGIKGKIIEARNLFKQFLDSKLNQDTYHYNYANTLSRLGQNNEAIEHYKKCIEINPNFERAWKNLGQVYYDLEEHEKEIDCYDKALSINPKLPQALFSKGVTLSRIYNKHEDGLQLMMKALENEEDMLHSFHYGYFGIAYANEKLNNLKESLKWINKGLDHYSEDINYLNFKSNLLIEHWKDNDWLKKEAIHFFEYRLELENDYKSLYSLILIKEMNDEQVIYELIKKYTPILNEANLSTLKQCEINLKEHIIFLLHYDRYLELRRTHSIHRYVDHLISELYVISSEFWELLDLIFATSFSYAISEYFQRKDSEIIAQDILDGLIHSTKVITKLIPDSDYLQEDAISIISHIYLEFPNVIVREFGVQIGIITGALGLEKPDIVDNLPESWFDKLREQVLIEVNRKLKLLKEE